MNKSVLLFGGTIMMALGFVYSDILNPQVSGGLVLMWLGLAVD